MPCSRLCVVAFHKSGRRGRRGTPAEVALRMLVLKHLKNWSYEQLEWEVKGNLVYRHFCRIDAGKVPDAKTMVRLGQLLKGPALRSVFERIVQLAVAGRVTRGRKMRVDTTVVETPIRYPSDSRLCEDVAQGVCREIERLRSEGVAAPSGFRNVRRSVTRRVREITHVSRRPIEGEAKRRALRRPYGRLLTIVRRTIRQAIQAVKGAGRSRRPLSGRGQRSIRNLGRLARVGQKVVTQTKERVFKGNSKSSEKLVSIFETQTKILRRGKAGKPTEFGQMVKVQEAEGGVIRRRRRRRRHRPCSSRALRGEAQGGVRPRSVRCRDRPWILQDGQRAPHRGDGRAVRGRSETRASIAELAQTRAPTLLPKSACLARWRRSPHRSAQEHIRNAAHSLQGRQRSRALRALGGHRQQPDGDRGRPMSLHRGFEAIQGAPRPPEPPGLMAPESTKFDESVARQPMERGAEAFLTPNSAPPCS